MSSPARDARLAAAANGFTEIKTKHKHGITLRNPSTGKCCFDTQVGQIYHYGPTLEEADSAWVAGVAPWNYQMMKADFNLFALSNLSNGQILKWLDPVSGQSVTFQPMALQWTNANDDIQQISMPQSVVATKIDDVLKWTGAYGTGRDFTYTASTTRLNKLLTLAAGSLPVTTYNILELNFIIGMSSGVNAYIDSGAGYAAWDKSTRKDTVKAVEFRLSNGVVVWSFAVPTAYDSSNDPETGLTTGTMRLKKQGGKLYVSVRFSKSWLDAAQFPIFIDPTLDYQVGASGNDGFAYGYLTQLLTTGNVTWGRDPNRYLYTAFAGFSGVTIPAGATITTSYASFYYIGEAGTCRGSLYFEDAANPAPPTTYNDCVGRTTTTNYISIGAGAGTWWNSDSINAIISELTASHDYSSGAAMLIIIVNAASTDNNYCAERSYDYAGNTSGPKLHIEYTESAGGDPEGSLIGGKLIRGGLLLHGVLGRS